MGVQDVEIVGLEDLERRMTEFAPQFNRACIRRGVDAGAAVLVGAAKGFAPTLKPHTSTSKREPGELRDAIEAIPDPVDANNPSRTGSTVSPTYTKSDGPDSPGVWGKFVEYGSVHNPQPEPFLRPAIDGSGMEAIDVCIAEVGAALGMMAEAPAQEAA